MTRPSEIKPREDAQPGTPYAEIQVGADLPEMRFFLTPEINDEYLAAIDEQDAAYYVVDGHRVAAPNVLSVYLLAVLYRKYPPIQGIVVFDQAWRWHHPIWAEETTDLVAHGRVEDKFEKKGRKYIRFTAEFTRADGQPIASAKHTLHIPQ